MRRTSLAALTAAVVSIGACGASAPATSPAGAPAPTTATTTPPASTAQATVPATVPPTAPTPTTPSTAPTTPTAPPAFSGTAGPLPADVVTLMSGRSWRPGCPIGLDELRLLTVSHWGFDGLVHTGRLVVHQDHADGVLTVLEALFDDRFPIERMQLVDEFDADAASMAANNTSAFNCRGIDGRPGVWSEHSYGWAIDVNPVQNPWVRGAQVDPPSGAPYVDRVQQLPGMIHAEDAAVRAFAAVGWTWGGTFRNAQDYQHFSASGR